MRYRTLGKTGLKVSVVGFGGIPIQRVSAGEAAAIVNKALDLGINFFDTARGYNDSEEKLGAVIKLRRGEAVVATKSMARTREAMAADINKSLETMGLEYIDLYQLHNVKSKKEMDRILSPDGALAALLEAKKEGLVGHIGITGHLKDFLAETLQVEEIETVQFPFNAVETMGVPALLERAAEKGTGVIVMKPLAGGALRNSSLALRYILDHTVTTVIPGMDSLKQVGENAGAGSGPLALTTDEKKTLDVEVNTLGGEFCRRCEYCKPCSERIDIPTVFLLDGYYTRYNLQDWARDRYQGLKTKVDACNDCGECEAKCPYDLPIRRMLAEAASRLS
ncbi:aldo/keto reductase [Pelotomaculum propionicicum]|uniref:aldo/keto reductase n=1 Tax=Pelotomaculum propionicicum TaxID=258475 RepID=UPI003B797447